MNKRVEMTKRETQVYEHKMDVFTKGTLYKHILLYHADNTYRCMIDELGVEKTLKQYLQTHL